MVRTSPKSPERLRRFLTPRYDNTCADFANFPRRETVFRRRRRGFRAKRRRESLRYALSAVARATAAPTAARRITLRASVSGQRPRYLCRAQRAIVTSGTLGYINCYLQYQCDVLFTRQVEAYDS